MLKLPAPVVPAAAVVSGGAGPGALQSRGPLMPTDPTQRLRGWGSSAGEMGHWTPAAEMTVSKSNLYGVARVFIATMNT